MWSEPDKLIYKPPLPDAPGLDPLRVERGLRIASKGEFNAWLDEMAGKDDYAASLAEEKVLAATREAFGYPQDKVLDEVVLHVLDDFLRWLEGKGSAARNSGTSAPPTVSSPANSTTPPTSDSYSTDVGPRSDGLPQWSKD